VGGGVELGEVAERDGGHAAIVAVGADSFSFAGCWGVGSGERRERTRTQ
jgi:hypothetical protein